MYHIATKLGSKPKKVSDSMPLADAIEQAKALSVGYVAKAKSAYLWSMGGQMMIAVERDEFAANDDIKAVNVFEQPTTAPASEPGEA